MSVDTERENASSALARVESDAASVFRCREVSIAPSERSSSASVTGAAILILVMALGGIGAVYASSPLDDEEKVGLGGLIQKFFNFTDKRSIMVGFRDKLVRRKRPRLAADTAEHNDGNPPRTDLIAKIVGILVRFKVVRFGIDDNEVGLVLFGQL